MAMRRWVGYAGVIMVCSLFPILGCGGGEEPAPPPEAQEGSEDLTPPLDVDLGGEEDLGGDEESTEGAPAPEGG